MATIVEKRRETDITYLNTVFWWLRLHFRLKLLKCIAKFGVDVGETGFKVGTLLKAILELSHGTTLLLEFPIIITNVAVI